jgi:hypothetical protein
MGNSNISSIRRIKMTKKYEISEELRQKLLNYLGTRPLNEVLQGFLELSNLKEIQENKGE